MRLLPYSLVRLGMREGLVMICVILSQDDLGNENINPESQKGGRRERGSEGKRNREVNRGRRKKRKEEGRVAGES